MLKYLKRFTILLRYLWVADLLSLIYFMGAKVFKKNKKVYYLNKSVEAKWFISLYKKLMSGRLIKTYQAMF